jgi:hypothetical protein
MLSVRKVFGVSVCCVCAKKIWCTLSASLTFFGVCNGANIQHVPNIFFVHTQPVLKVGCLFLSKKSQITFGSWLLV